MKNDVLISQRNDDDSGTLSRVVSIPAAGADGMLGFNGAMKRPVFFTLGTSFTIANGVIDVPISAGQSGPPGPAGSNGADGARGLPGADGKDGISPALSIGTVTSGASASATLSGTAAAPVLNLVLQRGATGAAGAQGAIGPAGADGAAGAQGPAGASAPLPVSSSANRTLNSTFQISATRPVLVSYAVDITVSALLVAGAQGTVTLQYADNSAMSAGLVNVIGGTNSTSGVLNIVNSGTVNLAGVIPAGKFVRIATTNTTGAPTFTYRSGQETLL